MQPDDPIELFKKAFAADDSRQFAELLGRFSEVKRRINDPIGPFDSPVITQVKSRAMLDVLLAAGADINAKSQWWAGGFGLLHGTEPELAAYAIERGAVVDVHAAARLGLFSRLNELIDGQPGLVHARGGDGQTPLHFAATVEIADFLLDHGAEIDAQDVDHESTPAQYMVRDRQEVCRHLVGRGCRTDVLMAAALGDEGLVRKHLAADPSCAAMEVSERFFPKRNPHSGGSIYIWTLGQGKSAPEIAREFGHPAIFNLLMERLTDSQKLGIACVLGDENLSRALLAKNPTLAASLVGADPEKLPNAARANNTRGVELMLCSGWPVTARGQHGGTALHWAAFHGNAEMTAIILKYQPPLEWTDHDFKSTPLGWATHGSEHGWHCQTGNYSATVQGLLEAGAKATAEIKGTPAVRDVISQFVSRGKRGNRTTP